MQNIYGVILAGGSGTRFWPLSRHQKPKQLIPLLAGKTTLEVTVERLLPLIPARNLMVVTNQRQYRDVVANLSPYLEENQIIAEPQGRNTGPAIALAAQLLADRYGKNIIMMAFPADHYIGDQERFHKHLLRAAECAAAGSLVTLGIRPNRPETGYGYIQGGEPLPESSTQKIAAFAVKRFVEKPDYRTAATYLMEGGYYWNSGIFIWQAASILTEIDKIIPELGQSLQKFAINHAAYGLQMALESFYSEVASVSIDIGVMEKSNHVVVVPGDFAWSDLGSWDSLDELQLSPFAATQPVITIGATDNTVYSRKLTALIDVENLLIVESDDALLICRKGSTQQVKEVVGQLAHLKLEQFL
ncbi:MAG: NTP transferase domain-containing protein [Deltaproteobacteria bacterium]|nr:NTP transferase domain-containing protein [Deltaproteobacteria bacterium]